MNYKQFLSEECLYINQFPIQMENSWKGQTQTVLLSQSKIPDYYCFLQGEIEIATCGVVKVKSKKKNFIIALKVDNNKDKNDKLSITDQAVLLTKLQRKAGIPIIYEFLELQGLKLLEMEWLQQGLDKINYSLPEITELTLKMLHCLQTLHNANYLYQALTPESFKVSNSNVYLVGLSSSRAIPIRKSQRQSSKLIGHPRFSSIRAHNLLQLSKRDDLESLFYVIAFLYYRRLPWSNLGSTDHKTDRIKTLKISSIDSLFGQMGYSFVSAFEYIMNLEFYSQPDYFYLKSFFKKHKTLIINPSLKTQERSAVKKISLNMSKKSQLPLSPIALKAPSKLENGRAALLNFSTDEKIVVINTEVKQNNAYVEQPQENFSTQDCCQNRNSLFVTVHRTISMKNPFS